MTVKHTILDSEAFVPFATFLDREPHQVQHMTQRLMHGRISDIEELLAI
jgi:hypothetical protein